MIGKQTEQWLEDYARVEQAILFLEQNFRQQPELKTIADNVDLSEYHFQRLFSRWAGISPKRFLQFLTVEYAKHLLAESKSVLETSFETGLSGPGRLHDLFLACEALTPGQYKSKGAGLTITYGFHSTPFGLCLLAITGKGICGLTFAAAHNRQEALTHLQQSWPQAHLRHQPAHTQPLVDRIFAAGPAGGSPLTLFLQGTNFQLKVWQALLMIPPGAAASYGTLAALAGRPAAARAVGQALSNNPIGYLIPCHRVIRQVGLTGDYAWGAARKKAMLAWEASRRAAIPRA